MASEMWIPIHGSTTTHVQHKSLRWVNVDGCIWMHIRIFVHVCAIDFATLLRLSCSVCCSVCLFANKTNKEVCPPNRQCAKDTKIPAGYPYLCIYIHLHRKCNSNSETRDNFLLQILSINVSIFSFCLESFPTQLHSCFYHWQVSEAKEPWKLKFHWRNPSDHVRQSMMSVIGTW